MKYLILALCVCAASAATFDYKPYKPYQPAKQFQGFRQPAAAPVVAAKATYNAAKFVATAPVVAAKTTYDAAKAVVSPVVAPTPFVAAVPVVTDAPIADVKSIYVPKGVVSRVAAKPFYEAAQVASAPAIAPKAAYDTARVVAIAPKTAYNAGQESAASILRSESDITAEGYNYVYETANGIAGQSSGALKSVGGENVLVSQGSFQYIAPDGTPVKVEYVADENGYQPRSDLLPVAPPVPELIARSLEYIRAHPPKPENY